MGALTRTNKDTFLRLLGQAGFEDDLTSTKAQDASLEVYAPDIEIHEPPSLPQGGVHKGREAYLELHRTMRELWDQKYEILHVWDAPEDDVVIVHATMDWTAKATGRNIRFPAINVLTFRDGLITKAEIFHQDVSAVIATLDPTPDS